MREQDKTIFRVPSGSGFLRLFSYSRLCHIVIMIFLRLSVASGCREYLPIKSHNNTFATYAERTSQKITFVVTTLADNHRKINLFIYRRTLLFVIFSLFELVTIFPYPAVRQFPVFTKREISRGNNPNHHMSVSHRRLTGHALGNQAVLGHYRGFQLRLTCTCPLSA